MTEAPQGPRLIDCPKGHPLALIPSDVYNRPEAVDPGVIENQAGVTDAFFALVDVDGNYECPGCGVTYNANRPG